LLCSCLVGLAPFPARAQTSARDLFERAVAALEQGQFADARDLFAASLATAPTAAAAFNLAVACRGTGETVRAAGVLEALIAGSYGDISEARRGDATSLLDEVRAELGWLVITVSNDGVEPVVRVDGRGLEGHAGRFQTPIDAGERVVLVTAGGFVDEERRIQIARGQRFELALSLEPRPESLVGQLSLEAPSVDLLVEIVGIARGVGALQRELPAGEYAVRVSRGAVTREARVRVEGGGSTRFRFEDPTAGLDLVREPAFWTTLGIVLVGGAVGIALGVVYGQPVLAPISDPEFGVITALVELEP
jgi:hypothetical protein